jgi:hypothetical protein
MGAQLILLQCSESLAASWWKPVIRGGYEVWIASRTAMLRMFERSNRETAIPDHYKYTTVALVAGQQSEYGTRETVARSPGLPTPNTPQLFDDFDEVREFFKSTGQSYAWFEVRYDVTGRWDDTESWWISHITLGNNHTIRKDVTYAILASGASSKWEVPYCKHLFRCSFEFLTKWWVELQVPGAVCKVGSEQSSASSRTTFPKWGFTEGRICWDNATIQVSTGPAFDPSTGNESCFLALDYDRGFWGQSREEKLAEEVEAALLACGATPIQVEILDPV